MSDTAPVESLSPEPGVVEPPAPETPAVEAPAPEAAVPELPASGTPETGPETPAPEAQPPAPEAQPPAPEADDPFQAYGGKDVVERALRIHEATQTEEGVTQLFIESALQLGLSLDKIEGLFGDVAPDPGDEEDLDRPITARELQEMREADVRQAQERQLTEFKQAASTAVQGELEALGIDPKSEDAKVILTLGDPHLDRSKLDVENVKAAVRQGHALYLAQIERAHQQYIARKQKDAETVPQAPAGNAAPATSPEPEPQNVAEAAKRVRKQLGLLGR